MIALFVWTISEAIGLGMFALFLALVFAVMILNKIDSIGRTRPPAEKCRLCGRGITGKYAERGTCGMCVPSQE